MHEKRLRSTGTGPAAILLIGALLGGCAAAASPSPSVATSPSSAASAASPSSPPTESLTPSAGASAEASGGTAFHVELVHATANAVTVDVQDASASLVKASSGTPGDGASVEPYKLLVSNDNPTTLRLTWVGGPCDSANTLTIDTTGRQFLLVQPECSGDSIVNDRILILEFSRPIAAADVKASLQDGLDAPA
jgi:hypothetical protein